MKKYLLTMIAAVMMIGSATTVNAQEARDDNGRRHLTEDEMISKRTNQMVQVLMLDDATAAKFVPVYSQYLKERMECRGKKHEHAGKDDKAMDTKTDAEIDQMMKDNFAQSHKMLDIREKYYAKLHDILTPKQIMKIYQTERNDLLKMKKEMHKRGHGEHDAF